MAKLIDANKAKEVLTDYYHIRTNIQQMSMEEAFSRVPTVEAIQVEWLRRKADEMAVKYWNGDKRLTLPMKDLPIVITQMIKEWKVENGREID